jgi:translation initiation factor 2 alpha subunit (eIF-2alpha)
MHPGGDGVKEVMIKCLVRDAATPEEMADNAASGKAVANIYSCVIKDEIMPDITVVHGVVVIAYGSERSIENIKKALTEISSPG